MKRLLISGGEGDFSKEIIKQNTEYKILAPSRDEMDITNIEDIRRIVTEFNPDVFLHPAALTRPMVKHIETPDVSITTNIIGTANVDAPLVSVSKAGAATFTSSINTNSDVVIAKSATGVPSLTLSGFAGANSPYSIINFYNSDGSQQGPNNAAQIKNIICRKFIWNQKKRSL